MASIGKTKGNKGMAYYIQLSPGEHPQRPLIRLGKCTKNDAITARMHIENIVQCSKTGAALPLSTTEWIAGLPPALRNRLSKLGIIESGNIKRWTVSDWVKDYIVRRSDVKEGTRRKWRDVEEKLNAFFRDDFLDDITIHQAKNFRIYLKNTVKLAENTIRRHIGITRQFFNSAVEAELISKNPFRGQPVCIRANESRFYYVTAEIAEKVLTACPDVSWKLIFGLARYGGLRCPSEVLRLKWQDVDFERLQFKVHASKTEHHADGGVRMVPMFPELRPLFQDAFDQAPEGAIYCLHQYKGQWSNLGVHMARIIQRAGLEPWPKIFQNLRSTRETELFRMTGGNVKAVCSWIGNTPAVAMQHYAQVTEADFHEAAKMSIIGHAEKALQKPMQIGADLPCTESNERPDDLNVTLCGCETNAINTEACDDMQEDRNWALLDLNQ